MSENEKRQPLETLRDGSLKLTFWLNDSKKGQFISVTPAKTYEADDGTLKDSHSLSGGDLLRMSELFREAHGLHQQMRKDLGLTRNTQQAETQQAAPAQQPAPQTTEQQTNGQASQLSAAEATKKYKQSRSMKL